MGADLKNSLYVLGLIEKSYRAQSIIKGIDNSKQNPIS